MADKSFVIVLDTPSIKRYVFGTDPLNEVRGASAWLDQLNRVEMKQRLCEHLGTEHVEPIYANGGSAQFLVDKCDETTVKMACASMVRYIREQTGGEVRVVYGIAPLKNKESYQEAVQMAHFQLRCQREFATCHWSTSLMPAIMECESASHLPAAHNVNWGTDGIEMLSEASNQKAKRGRASSRHGLWAEWIKHLANAKPWPEAKQWDRLRCESMTDIGEQSSWRNYIGVVYADGNAMGKTVQALDRPETFRQFSKIVDKSIREACFAALDQVFQPEIDKVRKALNTTLHFKPIAADILLLGGDDLLVALPADRALAFALLVTKEFERLTREKIAALQDEKTRQFFRGRCVQSFTISCGVAIAKSNYPFYLSLDLAEQLLKNAKRQDSHYPQPKEEGASRIDFHVVAGATSHALRQVREETYRVSTDSSEPPRTLRPLSCSQLEKLRISVQELREAEFPRNKLHELQEAALTADVRRADWHMRDIFVRCQHGRERSQRRALWQAVEKLCPEGYEFDFPWFKKDGHSLLCVADLVDAYDLFER